MKFDRKKFFAGYKNKFGSLQSYQVEGLERLLWGFETYYGWWDNIFKIANALAQIKRETAHSFIPVVEGYYLAKTKKRDRGYFQGDYANVRAFQSRLRYQPYFGRGDIQLTWRENYEAQTGFIKKYFPEIVTEFEKAGQKFDLVKNPEQMLDDKISFCVVTIGMNKGTFRRKLSFDDFIRNGKPDYAGMRDIVNGDKNYKDRGSTITVGQEVAGDSKSFEQILKNSAVSSDQSADPLHKPSDTDSTQPPRGVSLNSKYQQIQGIKGNSFVTDKFIEGVEKMSGRLKTKPEYILAVMSFETGGSFDPSIQNPIGATGLIQFLMSTADSLGTTTTDLKAMSAVEQLEFVEKHFKPFKGKLDTLEAVYTAILSGSPNKPDDVMFRAGTPAYKLNPMDWNKDGKITAAEATTAVSARLLGGVKMVQQKLLDLGFVPENLQGGFADGRWGENTSVVLAKFQESKKLPETGLLDEATGTALFGVPAEEPETTALKRGDQNDAVKKLHDVLVEFGYLTMDEIGGGYGIFGPLTEGAVKALQEDLGFPETGIYDMLEQAAVNTISDGIGRGSSAIELVKLIQNQLVELNYLTQIQVDTGFGIFGPQTEKAVKQFQKENQLPESGVVEKIAFGLIFNRSSATSPEIEVFTATSGEHYDVANGILMTKSLEKKLAEVARLYFEKKNKKLFITSGYRPPERQAMAMYNNIKKKGEGAVRGLYRNKGAIDQILASYRSNKTSRQKTVEAMTDTITKQVGRGVFISRHLRSNALDIRTTADFRVLGGVAARVGGRVITEGDHYHMEL